MKHESEPIMNTYIIFETGQNHNGDIEIAKKLIDIAAMPIFDFYTGEKLPGVSAVKFVKRDLEEELTEEEANRPYTSPHSFGATYGEHRRALEFSMEQHAEIEQYAHSRGLNFIETLCSPGCLKILDYVHLDAIKIASRDVTNIPLLEALAPLGYKMIISSGMSTLEELRKAIKILSQKPKEITILHCVSQYPAEYENLNMRSIPFLRKEFPEYPIGYSDHSIGILMPAIAVSLGASVIEKHVTLSRQMKGSDHAGSLEPEGLWRVVRDIRNTEKALGTETKDINPAVFKTREKLARSLALQVPLAKGEILKESFLCMRSPGTGMSWEERCHVIGKRVHRDLPPNSLISKEDFE